MVSANNAINNTVGASISGVTNTLNVTNPSNTASSAAREIITVGGATAGDPWINFNVSGVTNWSIGIDNSSNDDFKISNSSTLGTTDAWIMGTDGQRNLPLQSCFRSFLSTDALNVTGNGTPYSVICDDEEFDVNNNYSTITGKFTAPVDGKYFLTAVSGTLQSGAANVNFVIDFVGVNGQFFAIGPYGVFSNVNVNVVSNVSSIFDLTASDQVNIQITVSGGAKTVDAYASIGNITSFAGFLLA